MKCLDGELLETKYEWPEGYKKNLDEADSNNNCQRNEEKEMVETCRTILKKNQVAYINGMNFYNL
jgi:hypothetical protein